MLPAVDGCHLDRTPFGRLAFKRDSASTRLRDLHSKQRLAGGRDEQVGPRRPVDKLLKGRNRFRGKDKPYVGILGHHDILDFPGDCGAATDELQQNKKLKLQKDSHEKHKKARKAGQKNEGQEMVHTRGRDQLIAGQTCSVFVCSCVFCGSIFFTLSKKQGAFHDRPIPGQAIHPQQFPIPAARGNRWPGRSDRQISSARRPELPGPGLLAGSKEGSYRKRAPANVDPERSVSSAAWLPRRFVGGSSLVALDSQFPPCPSCQCFPVFFNSPILSPQRKCWGFVGRLKGDLQGGAAASGVGASLSAPMDREGFNGRARRSGSFCLPGHGCAGGLRTHRKWEDGLAVDQESGDGSRMYSSILFSWPGRAQSQVAWRPIPFRARIRPRSWPARRMVLGARPFCRA